MTDMFGLLAPLLVLAIIHPLGVIFAMIDLLRREDPDVTGNSRVLWALIVFFIPFAWVVYFVAGRR